MGGRGSSGKLDSRKSKSNAFTKTIFNDVSGYDKSEYGEQLAFSAEGELAYQITYNGNKAFAVTDEKHYGDTIYIERMASTGSKSGTHLLYKLAMKAKKEGKSLSWSADEPSANSYYSHIGASSYAKRGGAVTFYKVPNSKLVDFIKRLRKHLK